MIIEPGALGNQLYEYMLLIKLPEELQRRVEAERMSLKQNYQIEQPQTGRPNVSLARFKAGKLMENKIINGLQKIAMAEKPFMIELCNYDGYPMHAVFIKIKNQESVIALIKKLKKARPLMTAAGDEPYFLIDPQIALAGRLEPDKYIEIMKACQHKKFEDSFLADSFVLLRKGEKQYQLVKCFEFKGLKVLKNQGVLF